MPMDNDEIDKCNETSVQTSLIEIQVPDTKNYDSGHSCSCSARTTNQWEGKRIFFAFGTGMVLIQVSTSLSLTFQMIEGLSPSDRNKLLISLKNPFMDSTHFSGWSLSTKAVKNRK